MLPRWMCGLFVRRSACAGEPVRDDGRRGAFPTERCRDVMWIDAQWMSKYCDFSTEKSWNYKLFPPEG
ncbi:MAG: hypothetical protein ACLR8Y_09120 [Alistipes indistinctus]